MTEPEEPPRPEPDEAMDAVEAMEAVEAEQVEPAVDLEAVAPVEAFAPAAPVEAVEIIASAAPTEHETAAPDEDPELEDVAPPPPAARAFTGEVKPAAVSARGARPDLIDRREPLYRECRGYRLRLDPADLARLRELPGARGKSDDEIGEAFFDGQAERLATAIADDVPAPSEIRVVVDPYSRQAFLALENTIRGILSF